MDTTEIQRIIRDYKQIYANKMGNIEEIHKCLETYNPPRLNQEELENMNRLITSTEIETVILKPPTNKSPGLDVFTGEFYQTSIYLLIFNSFLKFYFIVTNFYWSILSLQFCVSFYYTAK